MPLPYDIARCAGVGSDEEGWREGCEDCLRRTELDNPYWQAFIEPPPIIDFKCKYRIEK